MGYLTLGFWMCKNRGANRRNTGIPDALKFMVGNLSPSRRTAIGIQEGQLLLLRVVTHDQKRMPQRRRIGINQDGLARLHTGDKVVNPLFKTLRCDLIVLFLPGVTD